MSRPTRRRKPRRPFGRCGREPHAPSTRHPFHREVLTDLDVLLDTVAAAAPDALVRVKDIPIRWDAVPHLYPHISRSLTPDWIRSFVVGEVARVAAVADSTDYLTARSSDLRSGRVQHKLTVQHRLSGLRAAYFWYDAEQVGGVLAKSYRIRSIDPDRSWEGEGSQAVHEWEGMGITSRLYQHGAALQPDHRWGVTTLTDQSAALRRRLHQIDPWRFAAANNSEHHPRYACLVHRTWLGQPDQLYLAPDPRVATMCGTDREPLS